MKILNKMKKISLVNFILVLVFALNCNAEKIQINNKTCINNISYGYYGTLCYLNSNGYIVQKITFSSNGRVTINDFENGTSGRGTYNINGGLMEIDWDNGYSSTSNGRIGIKKDSKEIISISFDGVQYTNNNC